MTNSHPNTRGEMSIALYLSESAGIKRIAEPVSFGLPFPKGLVSDSDGFLLCKDKGGNVPVQSRVLARWSDASLKWVFLDFKADVDANGESIYHLRYEENNEVKCVSEGIMVCESRENVVIDTGKATFILNRRICKPFDRIIVSGADLLPRDGTSLVLTGENSERCLCHINEVAVESKGPLRATIRVAGELQINPDTVVAKCNVSLNFFANSGLVELEVTLHNPRAALHPGGLWDLGDGGSIFFTDFSLSVPMLAASARRAEWSTDRSHSRNLHSGEDLQIYQDSSGGENWRSTNHVNRHGEVPVSFRGYRVSQGDSLIHEGLRATPSIALQGDHGRVVAAIDKFWQNFPKAMDVDGDTLNIRLFPHQFSDLFELQGGEQKTHKIYLQCCAVADDNPTLDWVHHRIVPRAAPVWYTTAQALPYISPAEQDLDAKCRELIDVAISGDHSFFARREIIDEYGWRHFGDIYADHEAVGYKGDSPLVAHYNNQYDLIYGAIVQYLRSGDGRWFELMADLARHVIDIDIYHTDRDRAAYNGGLFWHTDHYLDAGTATHRSFSKASLQFRNADSYGGGPSNEHNYTSGLLHYYYLSGDERARGAVLSLADWVVNMDDGSERFLGWLDRRPTGLCSSSASRDYHGPGRGAGNSVVALVDAYYLTDEMRFLLKAEQLIRRCVHPRDDFDAKHLSDIETHWSYLVFLQALGKYLDCKVERGDLDQMFQYARASLLHYSQWMVDHEVPYAQVLHKVAIPTETWPAQDIRKSIVFHMAAKYAPDELRDVFREKAGNFYQACITDLLSFSTCTLARPLALLMSNAHVHSYFQNYAYDPVPYTDNYSEFDPPKQFSPQFAEVYWAREKIQEWLGRVKQRRVGTLDSAPAKGGFPGESHGG